jgi:hypothetical protein
MGYHIPLPGESFQDQDSGESFGTVIASVWINDDCPEPFVMLLTLMPESPFYRILDIAADRTGQWHVERDTIRSHPNIVPAVEDYSNSGGDY